MATSRLAQRGVAELRLERTNHEKTKRLEMEMQIALRRGELIEKSVVLQQAGFLLTALRQRCLAAPSAWSRRILNISDPREMNERLREMMVSVLEEIADLPERVTDPNWVAEGDATPFAEDDRGNGDGKLRE